MPHQLEGFKLASRTKMDSKRVVFAILLAAAIGALVFFWIALHIYYRLGAESGRMNVWSLGFGDGAFRLFLQNWIYYRSGPNYEGIAFMGIGFAMALLFMVLRLRFFWWPLHPLGYAISGSLGMRELWLSFLISSCIKWIIVKYRGFSGYRHTVPFFLGLILGDFTLGSFWSILGIVLGIRTYDFWP
jgi:hypothetical protein